MHVDAYTEALRHTFVEASSLGGDRTQDVVCFLAATLNPALRLVALQMLANTVDELSGEFDGVRVAVATDGATPHLLVTQANWSDEWEQDHVAGPSRHTETPVRTVPEMEKDPKVRAALHLFESLRQQIDAAARMQGYLVSTRLMEAARGTLSEQSSASGSQRPPDTKSDGTGFNRSANGSNGGCPTSWCARPA